MRIRSLHRTTAVAAALLLATGGLAAQQPPGDELTDVVFAPSLRVDLARSQRLASGAYRRDLRPGLGDSVRAGATLTLRVAVRLPDGTAAAVDQPAETRQWWPGTYLRGVEQGLRGMRAGGRRQVVLPASLGYQSPVPGIPAGTPLVVEIALLGVS